jgi:hypothetical protein
MSSSPWSNFLDFYPFVQLMGKFDKQRNPTGNTSGRRRVLSIVVTLHQKSMAAIARVAREPCTGYVTIVRKYAGDKVRQTGTADQSSDLCSRQ